MSFTKKQIIIGSVTISAILAVTVSLAAGGAFAFCTYVVLTA